MKKLTAILAAIIMSLSATSCAIYDENDTLPDDFPFMHIFDDSEAAPEQTTTENESEAPVTTTAYVTTADPETTAVTATTTAKTTVKTTTTTTTAPIETIDVEPVQNKLKYHEYIARDFSDNLIRLEKSRGIFNVYNSRTWYFFNFGDHASSGIGKNGYHSSDDNGFLAFVSDKCSRDYIAYARENPGAVTSEIQRQLLQINLLSEYADNDGEQLRLENDMIFSTAK